MMNISNLFSDENIKSTPSTKKNPSPSLIQGKKYKKYQNKIDNSLEKKAKLISSKEGFSDLNGTGLTKETNDIIDRNNLSSRQDSINNLRQQYNNTLQEYENLIKQINGNITGYIERTNPNNPYLNKIVQFTTGHVCYVTNQGVVKWIPSMEVWQSLSISQTIQMPLNIPWLESYYTPGTTIQTNPPLISGTNVESGQSFGNEGTNVFVDQLLPPNVNPEYMGCYAANSNNDNMTFIGGSPPPLTNTSIQNGNFSQPIIPNNSYQYITSSSAIPGWYFGGPALLNNSSAWGYPTPYPNGNQCVSLQNTTYINTMLNLSAGVNYTLTFYACGRNCCDGSNPINIRLYTTSDEVVEDIYNFQPPINQWTNYTVNFTSPVTGTYKLFFIGTWTAGDRSTAIQNIQLNSTGSASSGTYSYESCQQAAISSGYQYFGLQNANTQSGLGYCAVSNSEPAVTQYGTSTVPNQVIALWLSNTANQSGNTAILNTMGSLQVLNSGGETVYSSPSTSATPGNCFLILQDDGNMCIYRGTGPNDNQGAIWCAMTNGKQQSANPKMAAVNGKYGQNWISSGSTLATGDFVGSTNGNLALVMQSDGNLVLYTYQMTTNCQKMSDGNMGGGVGANAAYNIGLTSVTGNMGKLAYVDADSNLYTYPDTNKMYNNNYITINGINTWGNDIPWAAFGGSTADQCKTACNNDAECAGFIYQTTGGVCWPKTSNMYPYGGPVGQNQDTNLYIRSQMPISPPLGVSQNTTNTNSVTYQNYRNKGGIGNEYGLANATSVQKQQLQQLQSRLNLLSKAISDLTSNFQSGTIYAENQSGKNVTGIQDYLEDIKTTNVKIGNVANQTSGNIQNILNDSDIVVLQKNYSYLLWSILAAGTVLVSMNIVKKQ